MIRMADEQGAALLKLIQPTDDQNRAVRARPWIEALAREFVGGCFHGGMVGGLLEALVPGETTEKFSVMLAQAMVDWAHKNGPESGEAPNVAEYLAQIGLSAKVEELHSSLRGTLANSEGLGPMWRYIMQSGLVRAWVALEAMTEDLWTGALDRAGRRLRQEAFGSVNKATGDGQGIGRRTIDIAIFAKHDFNLQDKLGTVLAPKVSFKTVDGISSAYKAAFGFDQKHPAPTFRDRKSLEPIEAMRHVIVHRGGVMDAQYAAKASLDTSMVGRPLNFKRETLDQAVGVVASQGLYLLMQTAVWLQAMDPVTPPEESDPPESG